MPHKVTAREERTAGKRRAVEKLERAAVQADKLAAVVSKYDASSRATMPESKAEQRILRKALKARGEELCRVGAAADSSTLRPSEVTGRRLDRRALKTSEGYGDS